MDPYWPGSREDDILAAGNSAEQAENGPKTLRAPTEDWTKMDLGLTGAPRPELLKIEQDIKETLRNHTKYNIHINYEYRHINKY